MRQPSDTPAADTSSGTRNVTAEIGVAASADPLRDFFGATVAKDGYRWWYLDAVSPDRRYCVVVIGFVGSVFSPYYAAARRRGHADPSDHCAINAIVYGPHGKRWAMTERGRHALAADRQGLRVGPSSMRWQDGTLVIDLDERCNPLPRRLRGRIELTPGVCSDTVYALHDSGRHRWWPVAPAATARVALQAPALAFEGSAYLDTNAGDEPLEAGFNAWHWSRREQPVPDAVTAALTYHVRQADGRERALALALAADGSLTRIAAAPRVTLPRSGWRVARELSADGPAARVRTLEDTPFYARSLVHLGDQRQAAVVHESLDLERFSSRWVQTLLPFRMPRLARRQPAA